MNRGRISARFMLCFLAMMLLVVIGCGGGGGGSSAPPTYSISGAVAVGGTPLADVTINLTGAATASTTTDSGGNFSFTGRANGTYTVIPVKAGYIFNPVSSVVVVSGANVTSTNFVATAHSDPTYSLSGTVSGAVQAGVTITLSDDATGTAITDASGNYSFSGLVDGGNYTVTPSLTGYIFTPANLSITVSGVNSTGNNFTAAPVPVPTYSISGAVSGDTKEGVTINLTGAATASTTTDADGNFSFTGRANGAYTVTPVKTGFTFTPSSGAVTISGANITGTNFVAAVYVEPPHTISGVVSGDVLLGVTITLSGAGTATTTTNASGNYSLSGLANGSYTITPTLTGYTFDPASVTLNVTGANITTGADFVANALQPDIAGTWYVHVLSNSNKWLRRTLTFNDTGNLTAATSCLDSAGSPTCPAVGSLRWKMTAGVITESGASADSLVHMTMTSAKNLIAGTSTSGSDATLRVIQKVVPGTTYYSTDLQDKPFVFHEMIVGSSKKWRHGAGATNVAGVVTLTSLTEPSGSMPTPDVTWGTMSVDTTNGVVTMSGTSMASYRGFLSDDKKTIVGTYTDVATSTYRLLIIQITSRTDYPVGPLPASTWASHMLGNGSSQAGWVHCTNTVNASGGMSFSNWASSISGSSAPTGTYTGSLSASGEVIIAQDSTYHGQASNDWNFLVGTQTTVVRYLFTFTVYVFQVSTR